MKKILSIFSVCFLISCSSSGPDKTVAGAVLGAGWGAGAGAIAGNQVNNTGDGAAIGSGLGMVSGAMTGAALDSIEQDELDRQRQLSDLKVQVASNRQSLADIQRSLDLRDRKLAQITPMVHSVYFDSMRASLRKGTAKQLEILADSIKNNPYIGKVELHGHAADAKESEVNVDLSLARAQTVATYLESHGVSEDQIIIESHGSGLPVVSIKSEEGAHFNRRVDIILKK